MTAWPPLYPLVFTPVYKDYLWGGDRIIRRYCRSAPPGIYAESWEISDRPEGMSVAANGPLAGRPLDELVRDYGSRLLGTLGPPGRFPLLIKILDARERLSVQVHPDGAAAAAFGGEAKSEAWYVLDAEPDAMVFAGVKPGVAPEQFRRALAAGAVADLLNAIPVVAGDVVFIPGGRLHAVGAGCLLLEVQQNSDTTFRIFDWNRVGGDGKPRALHVDQALRVMRWRDAAATLLREPPEAPEAGVIRERLVAPHFRLDQMAVGGSLACSTGGRSFHILFVAKGAVQVKAGGAIVAAAAGTTLLIPAAVDAYAVAGQGAAARVLRVSLPGAHAAP